MKPSDFDALMDRLRFPKARVWDCTPRESLEWDAETSKSFDSKGVWHEREIVTLLPNDEGRAYAESEAFTNYVAAYHSPPEYGSPEHNARREAFGLEPVEKVQSMEWRYPVVRVERQPIGDIYDQYGYNRPGPDDQIEVVDNGTPFADGTLEVRGGRDGYRIQVPVTTGQPVRYIDPPGSQG